MAKYIVVNQLDDCLLVDTYDGLDKALESVVGYDIKNVEVYQIGEKLNLKFRPAAVLVDEDYAGEASLES